MLLLHSNSFDTLVCQLFNRCFFLHMFCRPFERFYNFITFCWMWLVQYRRTIYAKAVESFEKLRLVNVDVAKRWSLHYESHFSSLTTFVLSLLLLFSHCLFLVSAGAYSGHIEHTTHKKSEYKHVLFTVIVDCSF